MNTGFLRPIANPNVLLYLFACYINDSCEMKDLVLVQMDQAICSKKIVIPSGF